MCKAITSVAGGKILPAKTIRCFHGKIAIFTTNFIHSLHLNCHSTCPLSQRILFSKETSRLYESFGEYHGCTHANRGAAQTFSLSYGLS